MTDIPLLEAKLRKALDKDKTGLIWYYRVGCHVLALTKASDYGSGCVDDVAGNHGQSRATLYRAMKFAEEYPGKEYEAVKTLPWTVVRVLLAAEGPKLRRQLQEQAVEKGWSARKLQAVINRRRVKPARRVHRKYKTKHDRRDLNRLAIATRAWQQVAKNNWPAERLRELQPGGKKLSKLVDYASAAMKALLKAVEGQTRPNQKPATAPK